MSYEVTGEGVKESLVVRLNVFKKGKRNAYQKNLRIQHQVDENLLIFGKTFRLQSIIVHHGEQMDSGHFTCFTKVKKNWIHVDDSNFELVVNKEIMFQTLKASGPTMTPAGLVYIVDDTI